jgi:preprotein translocase subunit SecA
VISLARDLQICALPQPPPVPAGLDALVDQAVGRTRRQGRWVGGLRREAEAVEALAPEIAELSDQQLGVRLRSLQAVFRLGRETPAQVIEALAAVREAADRRIGQRPYLVQIMGALALHRGRLVEMATGEGKTLTAGLAAVLAGWTRRPTHLVTVNDYLARRDPTWLAPLYQFCGVSVASVTSEMDPAARAEAYAKDVTYTTTKEVVADFLRDRLRIGNAGGSLRWLIRRHFNPRGGIPDGVVMRGLHTAIVDEADSALIDEAVTPLIISGLADDASFRAAFDRIGELVDEFVAGIDYQVNARYREVELLPAGRAKVLAAGELLPQRWRSPVRQTELVEQALAARELFHRGKQYVIRDGKVVIVDEFTGRVMANRKWRLGLHQAIEAKEGVPVSSLDVTLARMSFQRFFRLYQRLAGMTGTGWEVADELWRVYRLPVTRIPTNRPCIRHQLPDRFFPDAESKWQAIVEEIVRIHATGRPILVGTRSVAASEELAGRLLKRGLAFALLNALQDADEARVIARAGQEGGITIATNMAGRGTDILLGTGVAEIGGLHVIATERHESGRIDRQLFGRAARQGDPGSSQAFVSADDELLLRFSSSTARRLLSSSLKAQVPGARILARGVVARAQSSAQHQAQLSRVRVLKMDTWLDEAVSFGGAAT